MYAPGKKVVMDNTPTPNYILGSGVIPPGKYILSLQEISRQRDGRIKTAWTNEAGEVFIEYWYELSNHYGYSSNWRNWLARSIPDLDAILKYKQSTELTPFVGARINATIGRSSGYHLLRGDGMWAAVIDDTIGEWGELDKIKKEMNKLGIPRSYMIITEYNVINSKEIIRKWKSLK